MKTKYVVKDKNGHYQSAYNLFLGKEKAFEWALQCAKIVKGDIFLVDEENKTEKQVFSSDV